MSSIVYLVKTNKILHGFKTPVSQIVFGKFNLHDRLVKQLKRLGYTFEVIAETEIRGQSHCFYDDTVYSDKAIQYVIQQAKLEMTYNEGIVFDGMEPRFCSANQNSQVVRQQEIYTVRVALPEEVYFKKNCRVPFPNYFIQAIETWPDLITVASLLAREMTILAYFQFHFLGSKLLRRIFDNQFIANKFNTIGKNCRIHRTATLESCEIGDNVEIRPFCYLRSSVIGSNTVVQERSSIKLSTIGANSFIMPCDIFNSFIGSACSIFTSMVHNSVIGDGSFIGGASGFSDSNSEKTKIKIYENNQSKSSGKFFLGSCVAENCFIGSGLIFQSGLLIPNGVKIVNGSMIFKSDFSEQKNYVANSGRILQVPKEFFK